MKETIFLAKVVFLEAAKNGFKFPITHSIRTSFWLLNSKLSTFAEAYFIKEEIQVWEICQVEIKVVEREFLQDQLCVGCEFKLGTFPYEFAYGKILEKRT